MSAADRLDPRATSLERLASRPLAAPAGSFSPAVSWLREDHHLDRDHGCLDTPGPVIGRRWWSSWWPWSVRQPTAAGGSARRRPSAPRWAVTALALGLVALGTTGVARAEGARLVADLSPQPAVHGSAPRGMLTVGNLVYFSASEPIHGRELWQSDGTAAGTRLVADLCPGRCGSHPLGLTAFGDRVLFAASDGVRGYEPYVAGGGLPAPEPLADVCPGPCTGYATPAAATLGSRLLFGGESESGAGELWSTDGTSAGTVRLLTLCAPSCGRVREMASFGGGVIFATDDALWRSDGTAAGTTMLRRIGPIGRNAYVSPFASFGGKLWFGADDDEHGHELWVTDGTAHGTRMFADLLPGERGSNAFPQLVFADRLYLSTSGGCGSLFQPCFWSLGAGDLFGPRSEPALVAEQRVAFNLRVVGERLLFQLGEELFALEPGIFGQRTLLARFPGALGPFDVAAAGGRLLVAPHGLDAGFEGDLWVSDGTPAGTVRVLDLPGVGGRDWVRAVAPAPWGFLLAVQADGEEEPWTSDGTAAGTRQLADLAGDEASSDPQLLTASGDRVWFATGGDLGGGRLAPAWTSDGTGEGTREVADLPVTALAAAGSAVLAAVPAEPWTTDPQAGLWRLDGAAGPEQLANLPNPRELVAVTAAAGVRWYFATEDYGQKLYVSDGSAAGTRLLRDLDPSWDPGFDPICDPPHPGCVPQFYPRHLTALGAGLLYVARDESLGWGTEVLRHSDGTVAGDQPLAAEDRPIERVVAGETRAFFVRGHGYGEPGELWVTDGTAAGTGAVPQLPALWPGSPLVVMDDWALFFAPGEEQAGPWLWASAGLAGPSVPIAPLGAAARVGYEMVVVGSRVFFVVEDPAHGAELWSSDGSRAGTRRLEIVAGPRGSAPQALRAVGATGGGAAGSGSVWAADGPLTANLVVDGPARWLAFAADDGSHGLEPWLSDGTPGGTFLLADVAPGARPSSPAGFVRLGSEVLFAADDATHGRELHAAALPNVFAACVPDEETLCLGGGRFAVRAAWANPRQGTVGKARARDFSAESGLFWFFAEDNLELQVKLLDGSAINGHWWLFASALTDLEVELAVRDHATGEERRFWLVGSSLCGLAELTAFPVVWETASTAAAAARADEPIAERTLAASGAACPPQALCLSDGRYAVRASWQNPRTGAAGEGVPTALTARTGGFTFFQPGRLEILLKILDGRAINGHWWLFHAPATDLAYRLEITDREAGETWEVARPAGSLCGGAELSLLDAAP
jgi:ELWxxDGT repeat protein